MLLPCETKNPGLPAASHWTPSLFETIVFLKLMVLEKVSIPPNVAPAPSLLKAIVLLTKVVVPFSLIRKKIVTPSPSRSVNAPYHSRSFEPDRKDVWLKRTQSTATARNESSSGKRGCP